MLTTAQGFSRRLGTTGQGTRPCPGHVHSFKDQVEFIQKMRNMASEEGGVTVYEHPREQDNM